ncbi:cation-translocating P-type ATPase [Candidatus Woesearchaeota archaeon]|nr:cation-translocating P-type ATPase [Candidatus Woesearchaeota archaeon]
MAKENSLYAGTLLQSGHLKAVITSIGMNTELGKIAHITTKVSLDESPLQQELNKIGMFIAKVAVSISLLVIGHSLWQSGFSLSVLHEVFLFSIALAVAVVPEGLPATVTIALAMGVKKMAAQNAIIRKLSSVETLGCTTVICTDKTGTLTKNEMTVKEIFVPGTKNNCNYRDILQISSLCNNAQFSENTLVGDPTELALLVAAAKSNLNVDVLKNTFQRIDEISFTSERKIMTTVHKTVKKYLSYTKGAPYEVVAHCTHIKINGKVKKFTSQEKKKILEVNHAMGDRALRVLACAYKSLSSYKLSDKKQLEQNMIFVGFVGMIDPPRSEVKEAIRLCKTAGITVIMTTGDQKTTASAIAKEVGIIAGGDSVITGDELLTMTDEQLKDSLKTVRVFAHINPQQKLRIVTLLQEQGHIVAMTGDGVNDAPALKKADIGVAMGRTGTDVSKEASKMVLLDDSFSTIVHAVKEGRIIYNNIIKFILYVFSGITAEFFVVMFSLLPGVGNLLSAVQILWIDLGTEVLPALALSVDPVSHDIMKEKPRDRTKSILGKEILIRILANSVVIALSAIILYSWFLYQGMPEKAATIPFVTIIVCQMINIFNCRDSKQSIFNKHLLSNKFLLGGVIISILSTIIIISVPRIAGYFHAVPLSFTDWSIIFVTGLSMIIVNELVKWIRRTYYLV